LFSVTEKRATPTFVFWYPVFLVGSAVGATAGSGFDSGFAFVAGLLSGMAISGWIAARLSADRWSLAPDPEKPLVQPKQSAAPAQGQERIRFASAPLNLEASKTTGAGHDILGSFSIPKGMYEFAMRKQIEKQTSSSEVFTQLLTHSPLMKSIGNRLKRRPECVLAASATGRRTDFIVGGGRLPAVFG
jgi:hypothetical protein